jgi:hypothetical protein
MAGQLIPPPELTPLESHDVPDEQRLEQWRAVMYMAEQFLLAGMRERIGEEGDLMQAYREWYDRQMQEHDKVQIRALERVAALRNCQQS